MRCIPVDYLIQVDFSMEVPEEVRGLVGSGQVLDKLVKIKVATKKESKAAGDANSVYKEVRALLQG